MTEKIPLSEYFAHYFYDTLSVPWQYITAVIMYSLYILSLGKTGHPNKITKLIPRGTTCWQIVRE